MRCYLLLRVTVISRRYPDQNCLCEHETKCERPCTEMNDTVARQTRKCVLCKNITNRVWRKRAVTMKVTVSFYVGAHVVRTYT